MMHNLLDEKACHISTPVSAIASQELELEVRLAYIRDGGV